MNEAWPPRFSPAERSGWAALTAAGLLAASGWPQWAALPLGLFVLACLTAPFLPRHAFFLPVIWRGRPGIDRIALTFDDGPYPDSTPLVLELLAKHRLPATFFVIGRQAAAHPELIEAILAHGHTIGNHSSRHDYLLVLRDCAAITEDIRATQAILARAGVRPLVFRPPVGITSPRLRPALTALGLQAVTFSCRIFDRGNRNIRRLAARVLTQVQAGDILVLHDRPPADAMTAHWLRELDLLFARLARGPRVVSLAELIGRPVMEPLPEQSNQRPLSPKESP